MLAKRIDMSGTAPKANVTIGPNQDNCGRFSFVKSVHSTIRIEQDAGNGLIFTADHDEGIDKIFEIPLHFNTQGIRFRGESASASANSRR